MEETNQPVVKAPSRKNKIIKFLLSGIAFMIIFVFLLELCSDIVVPKVNRLKYGIKFYTATGYCSEPQDSIDAIILGNSNSYCSVSPMEIWNKYGYTSYNCGEPLLRMSDLYYKLQDVLKYQSPKIVLLETDAFFSTGTRADDLNGNIETNITHSLPVFEYHNRWKTLKKEDFILQPDYYMHISEKGYVFSKVTNPCDVSAGYMDYTDEVETPLVTTTLYFDKIYNLCAENGIQIILFDVLSPASWNYKKHNGVQQIADNYGLPFIDFNTFYSEVGMSLSTDIRDKGNHLNHTGAVKVTNYLADYIAINYPLTDHRSDDAYVQWNNDYATYIDDVATNYQAEANNQDDA